MAINSESERKVSTTRQRIEIKNRKATHNYIIMERFEAGISLLGSEIKAIRQGKVSLGEGWVDISADLEIQLENVHIGKYKQASLFNHDPLRSRKLLLHKKEIISLANSIQSKGFSLVPLRLYEKRSLIKVEIALAKGKKHYDKRESDKKASAKKEIASAIKKYNS